MASADRNHSNNRAAWLILAGVWFINLFLSMLTQSVSPLLPALISEFDLSHGTGGFLYALPILMIALFSYPLGILSDRMGTERMVGLGFTMAVVSSLLRPLSGSFSHLALSTAIFGLGYALCFPNLAKVVKEHFPPSLAGTATGIYTTALPLGAGLGVSLSRPLVAAMGGWRGVFWVWSLSAIPAILLWLLVVRTRSRKRKLSDPARPNRPDRQVTHSGRSLFRQSSGPVLICGVLLSLLNLIFYCTLGWLPTYLSEQGWPSTEAAAATSLISYVEIPAVFLIPVMSDRMGRRKPIMIVSFLLIAICSGAVSLWPSLSWWITPLLGMSFGGIFGLILAIPVELVGKEIIGRAAGAIISVGYIGALIGPPAAGYLRDITGSFTTGFLAMALAGLVAMSLSSLLPAPVEDGNGSK